MRKGSGFTTEHNMNNTNILCSLTTRRRRYRLLAARPRRESGSLAAPKRRAVPALAARTLAAPSSQSRTRLHTRAPHTQRTSQRLHTPLHPRATTRESGPDWGARLVGRVGARLGARPGARSPLVILYKVRVGCGHGCGGARNYVSSLSLRLCAVLKWKVVVKSRRRRTVSNPLQCIRPTDGVTLPSA